VKKNPLNQIFSTEIVGKKGVFLSPKIVGEKRAFNIDKMGGF
jgi:hypothetical protein